MTEITMTKCKSCNGEGYYHHHENQAPLGSGMVWNETISEECENCLNLGICPNCSYKWSKDTFQDYIDWVSFNTHIHFECPRCNFKNW